jgi:hypothetical protein
MPIATPGTSEDTAAIEVDALVVGAGAAGMTAALVSSLEGLDVLLCEKSDRVGGTTATSAGTIWVPGTRQSREAGLRTKSSTPAISRCGDQAAPDERRDVYLETGPHVVDYLDRRSEVKFTPYTRHPDYLANRLGATIGGRPLAPLPFDGRLLGADFRWCDRRSEGVALGSMMVGATISSRSRGPLRPHVASCSAALLGRHATDRLAIGAGQALDGQHSSPGSFTACAATACRSG